MTTAEPRLLILETSGRAGQVAVAQGATLRGARRLEEARRHARDLAPAVAELLAEQHWQPRALHGVIVSRGPGSYTGLRVGIMAAKTLAYATGCTLLAVDTFAAVALQGPAEALVQDVIADAQQDRVYVQRFARPRAEAAWQPQLDLGIERVELWLARLGEDMWISGPGLHSYAGRLPLGSRIVAAEHWEPRAESLVALGLPRYLRGERDDVWTVEPLYLRPSAAEEQRQKR
jgi:tRNA threonylcarbamoyladenosine biosynthesis protein TsaB